MKILWCWRCRMEVPMLDEEEFKKARELYSLGFKELKRPDRFKPLRDYYNGLAGFDLVKEGEHSAIIHHEIALYGPRCERCNKPYRTPEATFCAACGNKRK